MSTDRTGYTLKPHPQFGFLQVAPTPSADEIARFYAEEFYSSGYQGFNNSALDVLTRDQEFHDAHREDICKQVEKIAGRSMSGMSVLDVGCGWAQALLYFKAKGAGCYGFDPADEAVEHGRKVGLNVVKAGMDRMDVFGSRQFDVVTLLNVLEHLADPVGVLKEIRERVLKPGGVLVIEVPNEFNAFQVCGQKVNNLHQWWFAPPAHLNYFNGQTLRQLLNGLDYDVRYAESSFPLEMFLVFGDNYVGDRELGRRCHERRMAFEMNMRQHGFEDALHDLYQVLADRNLGRQVIAYSVPR
ncbi:MAG: class I SAM-dependent methyltransferase [Dongiaceae bacterium]